MSWLFGDIPHHWKSSRLDRVASVNARIGWKALTADEYQSAGYAFLATPNIKSSVIDFDQVNYISTYRYEESPSLKLSIDDVLLAKDGNTLGIVNIVRQLPRPATVNGSIALIRACGIHPNYLHFLIASKPLQEHIQSLKDGMGVPHLFQRDIRRFPVLLPPLEEQRRIADFLDAETARIDRLWMIRDRQRKLLLERFAAEWGELVARVATRSEWLPIRRFIQAITDGPFGSSLTSSHYRDEGARVIRLGNIGRASFKAASEAFISLDYYRELRRHAVVPGDLIVAGLGDENHPVGRACVAPDGLGPSIVKADCFRIRFDQSLLTHQYAAWAMSSPVIAEEVSLLTRGSTRARINLGVAREIEIPVPPLSEQARIVSALESRRLEIAAIVGYCERQLEVLTEQRRALITAAVTGRVDVTTARGTGTS
ncbi:restriction endonuclease subunit S [Kribbella sancticallisti]|uniref:Restriction endonuclease subunit S n=1 Tax=Kribbella sancticallisti TaxID=460087 RepID=A0ABP4N5I9_9ACTN